MKQVLSSIFFLFVMLNSSAESLQNKKIYLEFYKTHSKSITIAAFLESDHSIALYFNQKFNQLRVCVADRTGMIVYDNTIDAEEDSTFSIPLDGILKGEYTLSLTNAENEISGNFIMEKDN